MRTLLGLAAGVSLMLGGVAFTGCATDENTLPAGERGGFAGGNGAFGETPEQAGSYRTPAPPTNHTDTGSSQSSR